MARGANLRRTARQAFNTVADTRGSMKCGTSRRGGKNRVCLAVAPVVGMKCGKNPINKLYACAERGGGRSKKRRKGRR